MSLELHGTVKKKMEMQTFASGFQKQELVLQTQQQYPQPILIEFLSDKIDLLDNVNEGDEIKIGINIRGRNWTSPQGEERYFNSIHGWRIEKVSAAPAEPKQAKQQAAPQAGAKPKTATPEEAFDIEDDEDVPF